MVSRWVFAALALGLFGCPSSVTFFQCVEDSQCGAGLCEPNEYCSFPDQMCGSGRRYGDEAAPGIAGQCVPEAEPGSTGGSTTLDDATSSSGELPVTVSAGTGSDDGDSTTTLSEGSSSDTDGSGSTGSPSSSTGGECGALEEEACLQCALEGACFDLYAQCSRDASCLALGSCAPSCMNDVCLDECCSSATDAAVAIYEELIGCVTVICAPMMLPTQTCG